MRTWFGLACCVLAACAIHPMEEGGGDDAPPGGGGPDGPRWRALPLLDEPGTFRAGNDRVIALDFSRPDRGLVATQSAGQTFGDGGAIFRASADRIESIAFSGTDAGIALLGSVELYGLERTPTGYIAMSHASDVVTSTDGGATFSIARNGATLGSEPVLAYRQTAGGATLVRKSGVVTTTTAPAPGGGATYYDVWAPTARPPIPSSIPADQCEGGPLGAGTPTTRYSVHVGAERGFIAYTSNPGAAPQVCISTDGGRSFYPTHLVVPPAAESYVPTGVVFADATTGVVFFASGQASGGTYVKHTTDGGHTFVDAALPAGLGDIELQAAFFAPGATHGWLAGYDLDNDAALLLATTDGGATWSRVGEGFAEAVTAAGGDKLYAGFALDADHVWIGGARGLVMRRVP